MMIDEFICEARVRFRGQDLSLNKIVARVDLEEIAPLCGPILPSEVPDYHQRAERRRRLVDYIAGQFAHALTEALFKRAGELK